MRTIKQVNLKSNLAYVALNKKQRSNSLDGYLWLKINPTQSLPLNLAQS
jgi:hypothetical protein